MDKKNADLEIKRQNSLKNLNNNEENGGDSNILVAIRIRPLNQKEISIGEFDIIRNEDKLIVIFK